MTKLSTLSRSIKDRVALITGAANGMGRATAHLFADEGAQVAVVDVDADGVERVAKEITGAGGTAHGWMLDLRDADAIRQVIEAVAALGREGITVNCICPGPIRTNMTAAIPEDHKTIFAKRRVPLRRFAEPEEVAHGTLSLVLPASGYINGVALPVDGGMTIKNA